MTHCYQLSINEREETRQSRWSIKNKRSEKNGTKKRNEGT